MGVAVVVLVQLSLLCCNAFGNLMETVPPIPPHHYAVPAPAPSLTQSPISIDPPIHFTPQPTPLHPQTPPSYPPVYPPKPSPPVVYPHPPAMPPVHGPPSHPHSVPRKFVAVQGVVYCKSCKYGGAKTLWGATPILGATVKLECKNTKYPLVAKATTDKNGYFFLEAPKMVTSYGAHKCKVSLVSSPEPSCNKPTDLYGGVIGGSLRPEKPYSANKIPFVLYSVGPFAFAPKCPI